jgi:hypothetical protein
MVIQKQRKPEHVPVVDVEIQQQICNIGAYFNWQSKLGLF